LSLAISKRLTELMHGTLWTEYAPERGITFHFTVAIRPRKAPLVESTASTEYAVLGANET
jgi:signal transduction histidine kinase